MSRGTEGNMTLAIIGTILQCDPLSTGPELQVLPNAVVLIDASGNIVAVDKLAAGSRQQQEKELGELLGGSDGHEVVWLTHDQYLMPGLIDTHFHAPQLPLAGKCLDMPLQQWLAECSVPLESRCSDTAWAARVYGKVVDRTLAHGTTTAVYFASVHVDACAELARQCLQKGQRGFVGKVCMDNPETCGCASGSCQCTEPTGESLASAEAFVDWLDRENKQRAADALPLVQAIITPRFIPACSPKLLTGLGELATRRGLPVQTHIAESDWAVAYVAEHGSTLPSPHVPPSSTSSSSPAEPPPTPTPAPATAARPGRDLETLTGHGLLDGCAILAHAVHATDEELDELSRRGLGVAHCPLSNAFYANGIFPAKKALDRGVPVGLGTDVGGVYSPSMLASARQAVVSSRILQDGVGALQGGRPAPGAAVDAIDAFYMATLGGARALQRGRDLGAIAKGRSFDALVVQTGLGDVITWEGLDTDRDVFQKILFLADDRHVRRVYVQGRLVLDKGGDGAG